MIEWFVALQVGVAVIAGVLCLVLGLGGRVPGDVTMGAVALVELLLIVQLVMAIVAPVLGNSPSGSLAEFYIYLISALLLPLAGGFWAPNTADLKRIREEISYDPGPLRAITGTKAFKKIFGRLEGEQLKTVPRGFDPADAAIDLLRYKQFLLVRHFPDEAVLAPGFVAEVDQTFQQMRPFLDYMSQVLTTDANGLPL